MAPRRLASASVMRPEPHQTCKSAYSTNPTTAATDTRSTNSTRQPYNLRGHPIIIANLANLRKPFENALENIANIANIADIANVIAAYSDKSQTSYTSLAERYPFSLLLLTISEVFHPYFKS